MGCWPELATVCKPRAADSACRGGVPPSPIQQVSQLPGYTFQDTQPGSHMHNLALSHFKNKALQYHLMAHNFISSLEGWEIQVSVLT